LTWFSLEDLLLAARKAALDQRTSVNQLVREYLAALVEEPSRRRVCWRRNGAVTSGDAAHIAITTVYGCDYLLTWNCRHIANAELHRAIRRIIEQSGYEVPSLCTPEELMGEEQ
jgi:hypothetical protein